MIFEQEWESRRVLQTKLRFYNTVKHCFGYETYLDIVDVVSRKALSRLRFSAHDLKIETGRYTSGGKRHSKLERLCRYCYDKDDLDSITLLEDLPLFDPIIESEEHVMTVCPGYHHLRIALSDALKCNLLLGNYPYIMGQPNLAKELGSYLNKSFKVRNPNKQNYK